MGVSKNKAAKNRRAIIEASEKLFRARGVDGVGLSALMKAAGFTQGGFYNHFSSKEALASEVVESAMSHRGSQSGGCGSPRTGTNAPRTSGRVLSVRPALR
jgi:AcrR family transcriptional regulator